MRPARSCKRRGASLASHRAPAARVRSREELIGIGEIALLALIGVAVGTYGTLVGLGGGFLIVPLLLLVYKLPPPAAAATSLVVIFCNAVSGSTGYLRRRRVEIRTGLLLAAGTVPGAMIGPAIATRLPHRTFAVLFGTVLIVMAAVLLRFPERRDGAPSPLGGPWLRVRRRFADATGTSYAIDYSAPVALGISFVVGLMSSIFGIGGGLIHVPAMIHLMGFPVHVATATSTFVLTITAATATVEYARRGLVAWPLAFALGIGVVVGAQVAAAVAHRLRAVWLVRLLTLAMIGLGIRMLL